MALDWMTEVNRLKAKAAEFVNVWGRLQALEPVARTDSAASIRYQNLMAKGAAIRDRISYVTGLIDSAFNWFSEQGSEPPQTVAGLQGLGVIGIGAAVVAGAAALVIGWLADAYVEISKLETAEGLIAQNVTPAEAWRITRESEPGFIGQLFGGIQNNFIVFTALGLAAWWVTQQRKKGA